MLSGPATLGGWRRCRQAARLSWHNNFGVLEYVLLTVVGLFSHLIAAIGFAALGIAVLWQRRQGETSVWLALAAFLTCAWALVFVLAVQFGTPWTGWLSLAETMRTSAWIAFLVTLLRSTWQLDDRLRSSFVIAGTLGFVVSLQVALDLLGSAAPTALQQNIVAHLFVVSRLTVAVSGLVLVHNLYVNSAVGARRGVRLLAIGLSGFFGYDLNFYTLEFLLPPPSSDLFNIRGAVDAMVLPLLLISAREAWAERVQVSRQVVFHTLSFSIIGFYLIIMAVAAYGLRLVGGDWGRLLQISFLFGTAILGAVVMVSPRFRAALRVQIAKNFFAYRYDYRQEWLRFIATVSRPGVRAGALNERVIEAVCTVVDSPGGALFLRDEDALEPVAAWNFPNFKGGSLAVSGGLARFLADRQRIVDFDELRAGRGDYGAVDLPEWASVDRSVWLAVPLVHIDRLAGFILLQRTMASRELNWEDFDLLRTLGRQAAGYIAEASTQAALDEAGKFDEFNRRFAFIMHDIKNLVSQLSLVARNAERHADNPAFRADMVATLQSSVGKMNDLLARLSHRSARIDSQPTPVDVVPLLSEVVAGKRRAHAALTLAVNPGRYIVEADAGRLEQLFAHLIQNAIDASQPDASIAVKVGGGEATVEIVVDDKGCGMSARFIRQDLFAPFRSTKSDGFGIGAYEAREIARGLGGRLDVASAEGKGTTFTVVLPSSATSARPPEPATAQPALMATR